MPIPAVTLEQYLESEAMTGVRHEFFDGGMYAMAGGTVTHGRICTTLAVQLESQFEGRGCFALTGDVRVHAAGLFTYPDCMVVCGPVENWRVRPDTVANPTVLIEVLSPSTERHDRIFKWAQYRQIPSLREYILVSQDEPRIERNKKIEDSWEHSIVSGMAGVWQCDCVGAAISLAAIYRGIVFPPE